MALGSSEAQNADAIAVFQSWATLCRDLGAARQDLDGAYIHLYPPMPRGGNFNNLLVPQPDRAKLAAQITTAARAFRLQGVPGAIYLNGQHDASTLALVESEGFSPRPTQAIMELTRRLPRSDAPSGLAIRLAQRSELDEYARIIVTSFEWDARVIEPLRAVLRRIYDHPRFHCFAALYGNDLVGTTILHQHNDLASINEVSTLPSMRGRGIGAAVVSTAIDFAMSNASRRIWLRCIDGGPAQRLYERLGFATVTQVSAFRSE